jgi:hypothetical protein
LLDEVTQVDACVKVKGLNKEQRSVQEFESNLEGEFTSKNCAKMVEITEPVREPIAALRKAGEQQRFVEQYSADLGEGCVNIIDTLLIRISCFPLQSGKLQATLSNMF